MIGPPSVLMVNTADRLAGAERSAWSLMLGLKRRGVKVWLAVGMKQTSEEFVLPLAEAVPKGVWSRLWNDLQRRLTRSGAPTGWRLTLSRIARVLARPGAALDYVRGIEDFRYPETARLLELPPERPALLHLHNLHGRYFDLRELPRLSHELPVFLTLHDAWLLSGHCAHSFDCDRWKSGCGSCPDLSIPPAVARDATAFNWERKRRIYADSTLYVTTPCRWLMDRVEQSILGRARGERRVIPYGIDLSLFRPGPKVEARAALGLPSKGKILLFAAIGIRKNPWKDIATLRTALASTAERLPGEDLTLLALGEDAPPEPVGRAWIRFATLQTDPAVVARYFQAADLYLHAARADTFPNVVLEALACGTPVVATAVGGIPEQIHDGRTGILTPPGDAAAMAAAIERLLRDDALRARMGEEAARDARERFSLERQADRYLEWYAEILARRATLAGR